MKSFNQFRESLTESLDQPFVISHRDIDLEHNGTAEVIFATDRFSSSSVKVELYQDEGQFDFALEFTVDGRTKPADWADYVEPQRVFASVLHAFEIIVKSHEGKFIRTISFYTQGGSQAKLLEAIIKRKGRRLGFKDMKKKKVGTETVYTLTNTKFDVPWYDPTL